MKCRKCRVEIPDDCKFCPQCGAKVTLSKHTKSRGNGTGSVYKRGKVWVAAKTTGYLSEPSRASRQSGRPRNISLC